MAGESLAKIAGLVPEVYFDLIARVAPGVVACVLYGFAFADELRVPILTDLRSPELEANPRRNAQVLCRD